MITQFAMFCMHSVVDELTVIPNERNTISILLATASSDIIALHIL